MKHICSAVKRRAILLCTALAFLLSSCNALWEREIYERTPHLEQEGNAIPAATLTANSADSFKNAVISVIRNGMNEAVIRVTEYPLPLNNLTVSTLLNEVQSEPISAYAVEYIAFDLASVLSQYTVTLSITYREDVDISDVLQVSGRLELQETIKEALLAYDAALTVEMPYYYDQDHNMENIAQAYYYANPIWAMELPVMSSSLYPATEDSPHRIAELRLTYTAPSALLRQKSIQTEAAIDPILQDLPAFADDAETAAAQTVLWLHDTLCAAILYDADTSILASHTGVRQGGDSYTAYGALVDKLAVSEGYALAFKLLCDKLAIPCLVVTGLWNGYDHAWNLVRIGDTWYHLDIANDDMGALPVYEYFLLNDEAAEAMFSFWEKTQYPAATAGSWTYETIPPLTTEEPEESEE